MVAEADEKIVPNSMVADRAHRGRARDRNARLRYCPDRPGRRAQACVDASSARSAPTMRLRTAQEQTDGVTSTQQIAWAIALSALRMGRDLFVNGFDTADSRLERQLALDAAAGIHRHRRRVRAIRE